MKTFYVITFQLFSTVAYCIRDFYFFLNNLVSTVIVRKYSTYREVFIINSVVDPKLFASDPNRLSESFGPGSYSIAGRKIAETLTGCELAVNALTLSVRNNSIKLNRKLVNGR
jgi:hypothetical protein